MADLFNTSRISSIDLTAASPPTSTDNAHALPAQPYQALGTATPPPQSSFNTAPAPAPAPLRDANGRILNPRSCVTCRRRKVKCNKTHPCANCIRQHIECVFPTPGRAPRKARKTGDSRDAELLARLRRLEGVVKRMGVDPVTEEPVGDTVMNNVEEPDEDDEDEADAQGPASRPALRQDTEGGSDHHIEQDDLLSHRASCPAELAASVQEDPTSTERLPPQVRDPLGSGGSEHRFGRLVVNEGKSRYINSSFWASLSTEVEDLKGILNDDTDEDDEISPSAPAVQSGQRQAWVFSFSSQNVDMLSLHPLPDQLSTYWDIYKENVDPLVKLVHIPSLEPTVLAAASHLANLSKSFEALLFAMYYAVVTSLGPEDCLSRLHEERGTLLARYKFAVEQALARANFLTTEEIVVLQSFVIFLICLRRNNDARVIWTLTGLIVRIAQTMGIHRDGQHFGLAPFEIEMRRRLWWQVCILDVRASEDHGCDPTIVEQSFDTKMPLNVNDVDLDPQMKALPQERVGCTDMTFSLIRFEVANTFRRINYIPPGTPRACGDFYASVSLEDKERWITECHERLEQKYLKYCDMTVPLFWVTATVARLMMSKMWLMVYHPFQRQGGGKSLSGEIRDKLFITSLENIEYSLLLETEARTMKWGWLFRTYMQWHAFAFMLSELCHRTRGELVERAWVSVERSQDGRWATATVTQGGGRNGHLWRPLVRLLNKARLARKKAIIEDQAASFKTARATAAASLGLSATPTPPPGSTMPRPYLIRAPLSAAQLQRFMSSPAYGTKPIDSTTLMRSPKLQDSMDMNDDMDVSPMVPNVADDSAEPRIPLVHEILDQQRLEQQSRAAQLNAQNAAFGTSIPSPPGFGPFGAASFSPAASRGSTSLAQQGQNRTSTTTSTSPPPRPFSFGTVSASHTGMPSIMDGSGDGFGRHSNLNCNSINGMETTPPGFSPFDATTGEIDWANWDDMVRQFGVDAADPNGSDGNGAQATTVNGNGTGIGDTWNGSGWSSGLGMGGMGIGGGVMF